MLTHQMVGRLLRFARDYAPGTRLVYQLCDLSPNLKKPWSGPQKTSRAMLGIS